MAGNSRERYKTTVAKVFWAFERKLILRSRPWRRNIDSNARSPRLFVSKSKSTKPFSATFSTVVVWRSRLFPAIRRNTHKPFPHQYFGYNCAQTFAGIRPRARKLCSPAVAQNPEKTQMADRRVLTDRFLKSCHRHRTASASRYSTPALAASASGSATPRMPTRRGAARPEGSPSSCSPGSRRCSTDPPHHRRLWRGGITLEEARRTAGEWRSHDREGRRSCRDRGRAPCEGSP